MMGLANTVILDGSIVGVYSNSKLNTMLDRLAEYYKVDKDEFVVTQGNPYKEGLVKV